MGPRLCVGSFTPRGRVPRLPGQIYSTGWELIVLPQDEGWMSVKGMACEATGGLRFAIARLACVCKVWVCKHKEHVGHRRGCALGLHLSHMRFERLSVV
jgi:hypothetical protein